MRCLTLNNITWENGRLLCTFDHPDGHPVFFAKDIPVGANGIRVVELLRELSDNIHMKFYEVLHEKN